LLTALSDRLVEKTGRRRTSSGSKPGHKEGWQRDQLLRYLGTSDERAEVSLSLRHLSYPFAYPQQDDTG
jgi:hypothetical protein